MTFGQCPRRQMTLLQQCPMSCWSKFLANSLLKVSSRPVASRSRFRQRKIVLTKFIKIHTKATKHLNKTFIRIASLVCRRWRDVCSAGHLWSWVSIIVLPNNLHNMPTILALPRHCHHHHHQHHHHHYHRHHYHH